MHPLLDVYLQGEVHARSLTTDEDKRCSCYSIYDTRVSSENSDFVRMNLRVSMFITVMPTLNRI